MPICARSRTRCVAAVLLRDTRQTSQKNVQILQRCAELLNVGDWDALFELYDADVRVEFRDVRPPPDTPEVLHGREGVRRVVAHWTEPYDKFGAEVYEYIDADPWVICDTRWYRKSKDGDLPVDARFADAYEVKDGKILRAIIGYPHVEAALRAVEAEKQP
jgi:ketosteroid isomerase-like protein